MQIDSLLVNAVSQILKGGEAPEVTDVIPELGPQHSGRVNLGQPKEAEKRVRERLNELRREDVAELKAKYEEVEAEMAEERKIAKAGEFNLKAS